MIPGASLVMIPPGVGNHMSFVGLYNYPAFKTAPLQAGDFAVYFSNFPGTEPTGHSGNDWTSYPGGGTFATFVASKVLEAGDIGFSPTNPLPAYDTNAAFLVYRGPGSMSLRTRQLPDGSSYVKDVKHCGMFMVTQSEPDRGYSPTVPATWQLRRTQEVTWGGTSLVHMKFYDRIEPANTTYSDGDNIAGTASGSGQYTNFVFELLVP